jgi:hypothetical protein
VATSSPVRRRSPTARFQGTRQHGSSDPATCCWVGGCAPTTTFTRVVVPPVREYLRARQGARIPATGQRPIRAAPVHFRGHVGTAHGQPADSHDMPGDQARYSDWEWTQQTAIRIPHHQRHPWSPAQRSGYPATTPRSSATATSGTDAADRCPAPAWVSACKRVALDARWSSGETRARDSGRGDDLSPSSALERQ